MNGYCKYCDSLIESEDMIHAFNDEHRLVWVGCFPCYKTRVELKKRPEPSRLTDVNE